MKIIIDSKKILQKVQVLYGVVLSNPSIDLLDCILIRSENGNLLLAASDLDNTIQTSIIPDLLEGDNINVAIEAKYFLEILKALPHQPIQILIDECNFKINTQTGNYSIPFQDGNLFPFPNIQETNKIQIESRVFSKAIGITQHSFADDDLRPALTGMLFESNGQKTNFVATDAHKLAMLEMDIVFENFQMIIPKKALSSLKSFIDNSNEMIDIKYNKTNIIFEYDGYTLISRLIDGIYPNYKAVIPQNNPNSMSVDRQSLLNAIKRILIFADQSQKKIKLDITNEGLKLFSEEKGSLKKGEESLKINIVGDEISIGFNAKYLIDILNTLSSQEISIETSYPNKAALIFPDDNLHGEKTLMLLMPVTLS